MSDENDIKVDPVSSPASSTADDTAVPAYLSSDEFKTMSVFELLGLDWDEPKQEEELSRMQDLIWTDFLEFDLPGILGEEGIKELEEYSKQHEDETDPEVLGAHIEQVIKDKGEDLEAIMYVKSLKFKYDFVMEHIITLEKSIELAEQKDPKPTDLDMRKSKLTDVKSAATDGRWKEVPVLLKQYDTLPK